MINDSRTNGYKTFREMVELGPYFPLHKTNPNYIKNLKAKVKTMKAFSEETYKGISLWPWSRYELSNHDTKHEKAQKKKLYEYIKFMAFCIGHNIRGSLCSMYDWEIIIIQKCIKNTYKPIG